MILSSLSLLDWVAPVAFAVGLLLLGFWKSRRKSDTEEFLLMGRRLTAPAFVMSLVTSWYGGILGVSEYAYKFGLSNWFVFGLPYYLHALIFAIFLARRARRTKAMSIPDTLLLAYGGTAGRIGALVIFVVTMPAAYLLMLGKMTSWMFGWSYPVALLAGVLFSTIYIYSGGLRSVVRTDIAQFAVMYGGFAVMVVALISQYGGLSFLHAHVPQELFTPTGGQSFWAVFVWYLIASTTLIEPLFYERVYAAKSERFVLPGIVVSILLWAAFDFMTTTTGLYARALLGNLSDPAFAFPELARQVLPAGLFGLFLAALLATIMSTIDSYTFLAAGALGRDVLWKTLAPTQPERTPQFVRWALLITTVFAFGLALISESIVSLWHGLGSIAAPALVIPVLSSFSARYAFAQRLVVPGMISAGGIALLWEIAPQFFGNGYWLGLEPIYVGLAVSLGFYVMGLVKKR